MKRSGFVTAIVIGVVVALMVLGAGLLFVRGETTGRSIVARRTDSGLLVALVLPDANGTQGARALVYYPPGSGSGIVVDPLTPAIVSGASGGTLGDALTFGGGAGLSAAYADTAEVRPPAYLVVDQAAWERLVPGGVSVTLPQPVDVFNGSDLVSFPAGRVALDSGDAGVLLAAIHRLAPAERKVVLGEVAAALQRALGSSPLPPTLTSDLTPRRLKTWIWSLPARSTPVTGTD